VTAPSSTFPKPWLVLLLVLLGTGGLFPHLSVAALAQPTSPTELLQEVTQGGDGQEGAGQEGAGQEGAGQEGAGQEDGGTEPGPGDDAGAAGEPAKPLSGDPLDPETYTRFWDDLSTDLILFVPDLLAALLILVAMFAVYRATQSVLRRVLDRAGADPAVASILVKLTRYVLIALAVLMAASQIGIRVGSLLAGIGILGLAVGLAAQESLANLIAGLTLLWDRPFRIGDRVTIAEMYGIVEEIGLRSTRLRTVEHRDVILPNREILNRQIVNHTRTPQLRLPIAVSIAYKEDTREAREVLLDRIRGHELIQEEPAPEVVVLALGASGVDLEIRAWLKDPHQEREVTFALTELAKIALDEAGIEIPFPQVTWHHGTGELPVRLIAQEAEEQRVGRKRRDSEL